MRKYATMWINFLSFVPRRDIKLMSRNNNVGVVINTSF